jgi:uncharacterized Zn finger protein
VSGTGSTVTHPRFPPGRGTGGARGAGTWWGKAWTRTLEESAYGEQDVRAARRLARAGAVGAIAVGTTESGAPGFVAAVEDGGAVHTATGTVPPFGETDRELFVEVVAAGAGRIAALLSGDLPLPLVEACEEVGVELVPYAGELGWSCTCEAWVDPCPHALAVATQVGWLLQRDPLVLLHLRGLAREELLADVYAVTAGPGDPDGEGPQEAADDLDVAAEAVLRARHLLDQWARSPEQAVAGS